MVSYLYTFHWLFATFYFMPIMEELQNIKTLASVGFDHKQAEALVGINEKAQVDGLEDLKEFIRQEIHSIRNEIKQEIKDLEVRLAWALKDLWSKLFGIIFDTAGYLRCRHPKAFP